MSAEEDWVKKQSERGPKREALKLIKRSLQ